MRLSIAVGVLLLAAHAAAQSCPPLRCPAEAVVACGTACAGAVTFERTASCSPRGVPTSCVVKASTGASCDCAAGACTVAVEPCGAMLGAGCSCGEGLGAPALIAVLLGLARRRLRASTVTASAPARSSAASRRASRGRPPRSPASR